MHGAKHEVILCEYDPEWSKIFKKEKRRLEEKLGKKLSIDHIGSTSIRGLRAKPIIDILIKYNDDFNNDKLHNGLIDLGYKFREDLYPGRIYYVLEDEDGVRYFSIALYKELDKRAFELITFKENLEKYPELVREYDELKGRLEVSTKNRTEYTRGKEKFILKYSKGLISL